ncbi:SIR2 family NAD-dependent protein deacylase [Polynucleobacter rarus]|uniref:SIR2 family NAD-dependent protein deacylase n=1 Tax=Polynucleobacter rarus TaxID=556055 RepID=UPI000D3E19F0|nr:Sir2 family NAD-dependent protein deacetylase [Polynucleobacter rarus]
MIKHTNQQSIKRAALMISDADGLIITAGAGIGVDSGLPDFRGNQGFWQAYPALANKQIDFMSMANPQSFRKNPNLAWGFYGHRLALYRETIPHVGFRILKTLGETLSGGTFVVTSNVDGQFQKAGFSEKGILEIHGSIHLCQCIEPCKEDIWSAAGLNPEVDESSCQWLGPLPACSHCQSIARPNILMFRDSEWLEGHFLEQESNWNMWRKVVKRPVVIELGAGIDIPSIRYFSERQESPLIRINPRDDVLSKVNVGVSISMGAKDALIAIAQELDLNF